MGINKERGYEERIEQLEARVRKLEKLIESNGMGERPEKDAPRPEVVHALLGYS